MILAGGQGTRLHPYTAVLPKPLVPVGERAVMEWLL
ncbi:MAG TPA: sugar phosphate nucleotidyltransferase, partial [Acetobacteraceae bacterium]|nr:sugar phosphate nucleotidyltransferase [Acetobacteraceae bacterium]